MRRYCILGLIALIATATPVLARLCSGTASTIGSGPSLGVVVIDDLSVIGAGPDLVVFDMTDPADPVQLGSSAFGDAVTPVGSFDGHILAFVYDSDSYRLVVIDLSPEGTLEEFSSVDLPDRLRPDDLAVIGETAWIVTSSRDHGLLAVDLSDLAQPVLTTVLELPTAAMSMTAVDDHLLIATSDGLLIADVSDPATPEIIGSLEIDGARSIAAATDHAYVASLYALHTIDITDLSEPSDVSTVDIERVAAPLSMMVADKHLIVGLIDLDPHIAPPDGGLLTFDVSDPGHPVAIANTHFSSGPRALVVSGGAIVAADAERGLRVFDPDPTGGHDEIARRNITMDDAFAVAVRGDLAYLGDQGLRVIDISDHRAPEVVAEVELDWEIIDIAVNETGDRIAVLAHGAELYVFSASDPENPVLASSGPTDGWRLALSGSLLAVVARSGELSIFDVSSPEQPILRSLVQTSGGAVSVAMDGEIAIVGMILDSGLGSMAIYDVGDPTDLVLLSQTPTQSGVFGIDLDDSKAAVATWDTAIFFDLTDPTTPVELGRYENEGWSADGISLDRNRVHLSAWPGGLQILDFSSSITPREVIRTWWFPLPIVDGGPLGGYDVAVHEGASIVADGRFGLRIFEVKRCLPELGPSPPPATVD